MCDGCRLQAHCRSDGRFAGIRPAAGGGTEPIPTVDAAALILERPDADADGRTVLGVRQPGGGWALPSTPVDEAAQGVAADLGLQYLDCGNVIGAVQACRGGCAEEGVKRGGCEQEGVSTRHRRRAGARARGVRLRGAVA